jgi:hypothetical protein
MKSFAVRSDDLLWSLRLARSKPRHVVGHTSGSSVTHRTGSGGVLDSLLAIQSGLEMFCHVMPSRASMDRLDRSSNWLTKILRNRPSSRRRKNGHSLAANVGKPVKSRASTALRRLCRFPGPRAFLRSGRQFDQNPSFVFATTQVSRVPEVRNCWRLSACAEVTNHVDSGKSLAR